MHTWLWLKKIVVDELTEISWAIKFEVFVKLVIEVANKYKNLIIVHW